MEQKIFHIRLINGDELLGDLHKEDDLNYTIDQPLLLEEVFDHETHIPKQILTDYVPFSIPKACNINKIAVISMTPVADEVLDFYRHSVELTKMKSKTVLENISRVSDEMVEYFKEEDILDECEGASMLDGNFYSSNTIH